LKKNSTQAYFFFSVKEAIYLFRTDFMYKDVFIFRNDDCRLLFDEFAYITKPKPCFSTGAAVVGAAHFPQKIITI
jgi:hypothetical protein